jgi:hypothetical protein
MTAPVIVTQSAAAMRRLAGRQLSLGGVGLSAGADQSVDGRATGRFQGTARPGTQLTREAIPLAIMDCSAADGQPDVQRRYRSCRSVRRAAGDEAAECHLAKRGDQNAAPDWFPGGINSPVEP